MNNKVSLANNIHRGTYVSLLSKIDCSPDTASVAMRKATAQNITDSARTWLQPRSNTCNDAAVVCDQVTFRATFGCKQSMDFQKFSLYYLIIYSFFLFF